MLDYFQDEAIEPPNNVGTVSKKDIEEVREALAAAMRGSMTKYIAILP